MDAGIIDAVRTANRISSVQLDGEIEGIIDAAIEDMKLSGIKEPDVIDGLYKQAIICYSKAQLGMDEKYQEQYMDSYGSMLTKLSLAGDYQEA